MARSATKTACLNSLKKDAVKVFAFSTATAKRSSSNPTKELIKTLEIELADQVETIKEEEMSLQQSWKPFPISLNKANGNLNTQRTL